MAKEKQDQEAAPVKEPTEFPVTLAEFLSEVPNTRTETKTAFTALCNKEGYVGSKLRNEWQKLMTLFETQPTALTWAQWIKKGGK